ncbi:MAG TPA: nuclear transport factor 2 family protein [Solirubrobacteraceae bacterium]|jgi:hypothetical protein
MHPFRAAVEAQDIDRLVSLLAEDVDFRSPIVFKPYRGRDEVGVLLRAVARVFEDFRYTRELGDPSGRDHALVFEARVGDRTLEGCDFIRTGDDGLVEELFVTVRPLSGAMAMAEAMRRELEGASA